MKNLIIVESPAKARTIKNFLDKNYAVVASKGHIRDLPKSTFGIKIENGRFTPTYQVSDDHKKVVDEIKKLSEGCDNVYLATDEDREGEAIAYHIAVAIGKEPTSLPRIVFHEITKNAITESLKNPRKLDEHMFNAQQARRLLDRIVGYKLSPLLSSKIQRGLSAGRVQSSALKIVVDREREIRAFVPVVFFEINGLFNKEIEAALSEYKTKKMEKLTVGTKELADEIVATAKKEEFKVADIETKQKKSPTNPPFMTSTLQQTASSFLGFSPKRTMSIAQRLYEGVQTHNGASGVITYMRTDSLNIAKEAVEGVRKLIEQKYGKEYLPKTAKQYKTKSSGAQEAHEAIRPTMLDFTPDVAKKYLKDEELKLYTLIFNRFVASQMQDAIFESQNIIFSSTSCSFKASGRKLIFDGFYKVLGSDDKDKLLPALKVGEKAVLSTVEAEKKQTEPPARYSEASLIKNLEALGIGRPSTYAPTVSILEEREYVGIEKKQIVPTEMGINVTEVLEANFPEIVDSGFTAKMEEELDLVAENRCEWNEILNKFYEPFIQKIESGKKSIQSQKVAIPLEESCPKCGAVLLKRSGRFGEFVSCSAYPKCKYTRNLEEKQAEANEKKSDQICDKCGSPMLIKAARFGEFLACSAYPECKNTKPIKEATTSSVPCPLCGGQLVQKRSKRGPFFGCKNYPKCTFISKFEPSDKKCSVCGFATVKKALKNKEIYECLKPDCKHKEDAPKA